MKALTLVLFLGIALFAQNPATSQVIVREAPGSRVAKADRILPMLRRASEIKGTPLLSHPTHDPILRLTYVEYGSVSAGFGVTNQNIAQWNWSPEHLNTVAFANLTAVTVDIKVAHEKYAGFDGYGARVQAIDTRFAPFVTAYLTAGDVLATMLRGAYRGKTNQDVTDFLVVVPAQDMLYALPASKANKLALQNRMRREMKEGKDLFSTTITTLSPVKKKIQV